MVEIFYKNYLKSQSLTVFYIKKKSFNIEKIYIFNVKLKC